MWGGGVIVVSCNYITRKKGKIEKVYCGGEDNNVTYIWNLLM